MDSPIEKTEKMQQWVNDYATFVSRLQDALKAVGRELPDDVVLVSLWEQYLKDGRTEKIQEGRNGRKAEEPHAPGGAVKHDVDWRPATEKQLSTIQKFARSEKFKDKIVGYVKSMELAKPEDLSSSQASGLIEELIALTKEK